jgi:ABC-type sugar transport system permease subunit
MLLNVNFDGLLSTPQWADVLRKLPHPYDLPTAKQHYFNTVVFAVMAVVLALLLTGFAQGSAVAGEHRTRPLASLTGLLPSLVPIAFGYLLAHNLEYILVNGQLMLPLIGNPPGGEGNWPLAPHMPYPFNDSYEVHHSFLPSGFYWYVSLVVIVAVHVYAVILAHRHLVRVGRDRRLELRSEYPWLLAMVGYTCLSLWLLAQPLTKETASTSALAPGSAHRTSTSVTVAAGWTADH